MSLYESVGQALARRNSEEAYLVIVMSHVVWSAAFAPVSVQASATQPSVTQSRMREILGDGTPRTCAADDRYTPRLLANSQIGTLLSSIDERVYLHMVPTIAQARCALLCEMRVRPIERAPVQGQAIRHRTSLTTKMSPVNFVNSLLSCPGDHR